MAEACARKGLWAKGSVNIPDEEEQRMKCKYCGGPLSIEEEYCPYCGALNQEARQHIEDMKRYHRAFGRTRSRVMDETGKQSRRHGRVLTIVLLVLFNVILLTGHGAMYDLQYWWNSVQVKTHGDRYGRELFRLEADGEYRGLRDYYNGNDLYLADDLREFNAVEYGAQYYGVIYECVMRLWDSGMENIYDTDGELIQRLAENIIGFYEELGREEDGYHPEWFAGSHKEALLDMEARIRAMLTAYCNMSEQDLDGMSEMSSQELMLLIGRRMGLYE